MSGPYISVMDTRNVAKTSLQHRNHHFWLDFGDKTINSTNHSILKPYLCFVALWLITQKRWKHATKQTCKNSDSIQSVLKRQLLVRIRRFCSTNKGISRPRHLIRAPKSATTDLSWIGIQTFCDFKFLKIFCFKKDISFFWSYVTLNRMCMEAYLMSLIHQNPNWGFIVWQNVPNRSTSVEAPMEGSLPLPHFHEDASKGS